MMDVPIDLLINLFNKYLLCAYCVLGTVLGSWDT